MNKTPSQKLDNETKKTDEQIIAESKKAWEKAENFMAFYGAFINCRKKYNTYCPNKENKER